MEIIALSGFARTGKDEAARVLVDDFGFIQIGFADKLREMLYALNPVVSHKSYTVGMEEPYDIVTTPVLLQDVIDTYGWGNYKETEYGAEIRRLLQRLGTEAGRQTLWDSIWIDAALTGLPEDAKVVVSDARFFNEFDAVRERGGSIWRIERDGVGPLNSHASETEATSYPHFAKVLYNNSTLSDWQDKIHTEYSLSRVG